MFTLHRRTAVSPTSSLENDNICDYNQYYDDDPDEDDDHDICDAGIGDYGHPDEDDDDDYL